VLPWIVKREIFVWGVASAQKNAKVTWHHINGARHLSLSLSRSTCDAIIAYCIIMVLPRDRPARKNCGVYYFCTAYGSSRPIFLASMADNQHHIVCTATIGLYGLCRMSMISHCCQSCCRVIVFSCTVVLQSSGIAPYANLIRFYITFTSCTCAR